MINRDDYCSVYVNNRFVRILPVEQYKTYLRNRTTTLLYTNDNVIRKKLLNKIVKYFHLKDEDSILQVYHDNANIFQMFFASDNKIKDYNNSEHNTYSIAINNESDYQFYSNITLYYTYNNKKFYKIEQRIASHIQDPYKIIDNELSKKVNQTISNNFKDIQIEERDNILTDLLNVL